MRGFNGALLGDQIATVVRAYVDRRIAALEKRLDSVNPLIESLTKAAADLQHERDQWKKDFESVREYAVELERERDRWRAALDHGEFERRLSALERKDNGK